jgi:hypothetical protein
MPIVVIEVIEVIAIEYFRVYGFANRRPIPGKEAMKK